MREGVEVVQGRARLLAASAWLVIALASLGLGLVSAELLVVGLPLGLLSLMASWRYYRSHVVLGGDALTFHYARPGTRTIQRAAVTQLDEVAVGLATKPVLVMTDGERLALDPLSEFAGLRVFHTRQALSRWVTGA